MKFGLRKDWMRLACAGLVAGMTFATQGRADEKDAHQSAEKVHTFRYFSSKSKPENARALAFSSNSQELAVSTSSGSTSFIRVANGEQIGSLRTAPVRVKFSEDGRLITLVGNDGAVVYDRQQKKTVTAAAAETVKGYVGLSLQRKNGKLLIESITPGSPTERDGRLRVGDEVLAVAAQSVGRLESVIGNSPDAVSNQISGVAGSFVDIKVLPASASDPVLVSLKRAAYKTINGKGEFIDAEPIAIADAPVLVARKDHLDLFSPQKGRAIATIWPKQLKSGIVGAVSPDGQVVALTGSTGRNTCTLEIHNVVSGSLSQSIPLYLDKCDDLLFTPDGKAVLLLAHTRIMKVDLESGKPVVAFNHEGPIELNSHPEIFFVDGNRIASEFNFQAFGGGFRWRIIYRNPDSRVSDIYGGIRRLTAMTINPQGQIAVGTDKGETHVLDLETCSHLFQFGKKSEDAVELVELSPDGQWLASFEGGTLSVIAISDRLMQSKIQGLLDDVRLNPQDAMFHLTSGRGQFRAAFPSRPRFDAAQRRYFSAVHQDGERFEVLWMEFGQALIEKSKDPAKLRDVYDTFSQGVAKHSTNGKLGEIKDADTDHGPERRLQWTFERDGVAMAGRARLTHQGGRLYSAMITYPLSVAMDEKEIENLLASFEMIRTK